MRDDHGFTLLETLFTIALVTLGLAALIQAVSTGLFAGAENESEAVAVSLAQEKMEEIRNAAYSAVSGETKSAVSDFPVFQRETVVTTPQTGLKQVAVNVYWNSKESELSTGLVSYVAER